MIAHSVFEFLFSLINILWYKELPKISIVPSQLLTTIHTVGRTGMYEANVKILDSYKHNVNASHIVEHTFSAVYMFFYNVFRFLAKSADQTPQPMLMHASSKYDVGKEHTFSAVFFSTLTFYVNLIRKKTFQVII